LKSENSIRTQSKSASNSPTVRKDEKKTSNSSTSNSSSGGNKASSSSGSINMKKRDIEIALSEFYLFLILLRNYQLLNFTGFRKILKKHDKLMKTSSGSVWRKQYVDPAPFFVNREVENLITNVENMYTQCLEYGNRKTAISRLIATGLQKKVG
jgi:SPX domain protein involved in polyphosphate accumulation